MPPDGEGRRDADTATANRQTTSSAPTNQGQPDSNGQADDLRAYLTACYGDTAGVAHIAVGSDPYLNDKGKYTFKDWSEHRFAWPDEADLLVTEVLREASLHDVYLCPYLMLGDKRHKSSAVTRALVHTDVDGGLLDTTKVAQLGGFATASGSPGNGHAYLHLSESVTVGQHTALCRGLGAHLGAVDSKIVTSDVLRPVGSYNRKPTLSGGPPAPVHWLVRPSGKLWDPQELAEVLGVSLPGAADAAQEPSPNGHRSAPSGDAEPFRLEDYPTVRAALDHVTEDRSDDTYGVVGACYDAGLTLAQARRAVNERVDLAARLAGRNDDDVLTCWLKVDAKRRGNTFTAPADPAGGIAGGDGTAPTDRAGAGDGTQGVKGDTAGYLSDAHVSELLVNRVLRGKYCWAPGLGWMRWDDTKWFRTAPEDVTERSRRFAKKLVAEAVAQRRRP